jgi:hypothetical protein
MVNRFPGNGNQPNCREVSQGCQIVYFQTKKIPICVNVRGPHIHGLENGDIFNGYLEHFTDIGGIL